METPENYTISHITGYENFGEILRQQKHAAMLNCVPVFVDVLNAAGYQLPEFFLAFAAYADQIGYSQSIVKTLENLAQDFEKVK